jgi:hypothetical protein
MNVAPAGRVDSLLSGCAGSHGQCTPGLLKRGDGARAAVAATAEEEEELDCPPGLARRCGCTRGWLLPLLLRGGTTCTLANAAASTRPRPPALGAAPTWMERVQLL